MKTREIKFKAKTIGNEWVFGNVSHLKKDFSTARKGHYISNSLGAPFAFMVRPETICQFTGLTDKNGKEIYEGDYDENNDVVFWCYKRNGWSMKVYDFPTKEIMFCHCYNCDGNFELSELKQNEINIIGNIYENPELL